MKKFDSDRRRFLGKLSLAFVGTTLLSSRNSFASIISDSAPFEGYNPYAEQKNDLRLPYSKARTLRVSGTVYCPDKLTAKSKVKIEVWHLSPETKKFNHKGILYSDYEGNYEFLTDFPNNIKGRKARIYFKISHAERTDFTELILDSNRAYISDAHWLKNKALEKRVFPTCSINNKETEIYFNITI